MFQMASIAMTGYERYRKHVKEIKETDPEK